MKVLNRYFSVFNILNLAGVEKEVESVYQSTAQAETSSFRWRPRAGLEGRELGVPTLSPHSGTHRKGSSGPDLVHLNN